MGEFLKLEMAQRQWTRTQLADACDVSVSLAWKWVEEEVRPSPASCAKIATALGVDLDYVLTLAGHRAASKAARAELSARSRALLDRVERWNAAVGSENEEYFWQNLMSHGDSMAKMIEMLRVAVNSSPGGAVNTAVSAAGKSTKGQAAAVNSRLRRHLLPFNVVLDLLLPPLPQARAA